MYLMNKGLLVPSEMRSDGPVRAVATRRHVTRFLGMGALLSLGPGCTPPERGIPVPADLGTRATVLGLPNERFFPLSGIEPLEKEFLQAWSHFARPGARNERSRELKLLAVSGGGEDGAFGAGLLCGWTERGDRPTFDLVTGVSTGALTAPFAYLGSAYDEQLRAVYPSIRPKDILEQRDILPALFDDAMADNAPLFRLISKHLNETMLRDIAAAYDQGRLLLIGTTNLDAQQPVIWNIGAIAKSGHPKAADTIRRILLASAAVPAAFPPGMFDVTVDGKPYQEMHVDGGAMAQVFLYPPALARSRQERMRRGLPVFPMTAYVIRNARLTPGWTGVKRRIFNIAGRAISTMIASNGFNDVGRIYASTQRDHIGFRLAFIDPAFKEEAPEPFDQTYMRHLFDYAYRQARTGFPWHKAPPQFEELKRTTQG
jgi:hypothetical protein